MTNADENPRHTEEFLAQQPHNINRSNRPEESDNAEITGREIGNTGSTEELFRLSLIHI